LAICILWSMMFYFVVFFILPCNFPIYYNSKQCYRYRINWIVLWDSIVYYIVPSFITGIFSMTLLLRVIYHRYRMHQRIEWRN
jgi:hypothetical protein